MRKLTLYRDDSTTQVVFENVKHYFWLAGYDRLCGAIYRVATGAHKYINWPRERFCWFKDEAQPLSPSGGNMSTTKDAATALERIADANLSDPATDDLTVPLAIEAVRRIERQERRPGSGAGAVRQALRALDGAHGRR
jgi:hypothetical protein